ncbi:PAS domain S-box protein [bacterium]|nr:PAS domain S-box protein [bacterium]
MSKPARVLIVEDEAIIAQDLKSTLIDLNYEVVNIVSTGQDALDFLKQGTVDVILMDIRIKGDKNGIETTELINAKYNLPVIFLTAYADTETMKRIRNTDAYGFIVKPASEQTIQGSIDLALYKHGLDQKLREREERLAHMNQVLKAIRNVNQLITKERNISRLIQGACDNLIETLGYSRAFIALYDGQETLSTFAYAGFDNPVDRLENLLRADISQYPPCIQQAYQVKNRINVTDTEKDCDDCILRKEYRQYSRFSMCLAYGGKTYGVMSVAVPSVFVYEKEEQSLFEELVDDVAFALYRLELEEKRKYAEDMLKTRERTLSNLMNNIPGIAYRRLHDETWTMEFISNGCVRVTGYQPIELIKNYRLSFDQLIYPEDLEKIQFKVDQSILENRSYEMIYRIHTIEGDLKWVWDRGAFIGEKKDDRPVLEGVIHDITEQKKAEEALNQERAFTEMALDAQTDTFFVFDPKTGKAVRWNKRFEHVSGYTAEEIADLPMPVSYYSKKDVDRAISFIKQLAVEKEGLIELSLITKDNRRIPYEYRVTSINDPETQNQYLISVGRDVSERKTVEQALRESEQKYRALVENMTDYVFLIDRKNCVLSINRAAEKFLQCSPEDVIGKSLLEIYPKSLAEKYMTSIRHVFNTGEPLIVERETKMHNHVFWIVASLSPIKDESGNVTEVIGSSRDITKRKLAENKLKGSEQKYRALVENISDSVFMVDKDNQVISVNPAGVQFLHREHENIVGETIYRLFPKTLAEQYVKSIQSVFRDGKPILVETKTMVQGRMLWLAVGLSSIKDDRGKVTAVIGVSRDITERKNIEEALIQSESRYRAIVEDQTELITRWLPNGKRTFVNGAYCRYYGKTYDELIGVSFFPLIHKEDLGRIKTKIRTLTPENPAAIDEHRRIMPDGEIRWHQWIDRAIFNEKGKICEIQSVGRDVTQRRQVEQNLRHANIQMKAILENTDESIMIADKAGMPVMYNEAYIQIIREIMGIEMQPGLKPHRKVTDAKTRKCWDEWHKRVLAGEKFNVEFACPEKQGEMRYFDIHFYPIIEDNEVRGFTEFSRDVSDRKKAEKAVKDSEQFMMSVFESIQDGVSILNPDLTIRSVNHVMREWYAKNEPLEGKSCYYCYQGLQQPCDPCPSLRCIKSKKTELNVVPGPSGSPVKWIELFSYPIIEPDTGKITGVVEFVRDITQRKEYEEALLQSESLMKKIADNYPHSYLAIINRDLTIGYAAGQEFKKQGMDPDDYTGQLIENVFGKYTPIVKSEYLKTFRGKETAFELNINGQYLLTHTVPLINEQGDIDRILMVVENISERKKVEEALRESETKFKAIAEHSPVGIIMIKDNYVVYMNQYCRKIGQFQKGDIENRPFWELVHPDMQAFMKNRARKRLHAINEPVRYEIKVLTKKGQLKWVDCSTTVIDYQSEPVLIGILIDITERKLAEEALHEKMKELEKFNRVMVGRENRMIELKREVNALSSSLGRCKKYRVPKETE